MVNSLRFDTRKSDMGSFRLEQVQLFDVLDLYQERAGIICDDMNTNRFFIAIKRTRKVAI